MKKRLYKPTSGWLTDKKRLIKCIAIMLIVAITVSFPCPVNTQAAAVLSASAKTMYVGDSITLKLTGTQKKVSWSSSKKSVATVNKSGKVTAKKVGTTTITAKYGKYKKNCKITVKKKDEELERAKNLGIVSSISTEKSITSKSFFNLMDKVVQKSSKKALSEFKKQYGNARKSSKKLTRYDAMVIILAAAEALDADELSNYSYWGQMHQKIGEKCWDSIHWDVSLFGDNATKPSMDWTRESSAYFYSFGRLSKYSGASIFEYDKKSNSMRTADTLTYEEAIRAAVRFYDSIDSNFPVINRDKNSEEDKNLLHSVNEKIAEIKNSQTDITYTGIAYYVSNSGDDGNNGLTPETAWATLNRIGGLSAGDAVFFERGGLWRGDLYAETGVTYSAYGVGEKPRIYGSPENGALAEKWELWYDKNGVKIWKYHVKLSDLGGIVFNDGESYASRVYSVWKDGEARVWDDLDTKFNIAEELKFDLQFYCGYPDDISSYKIPFDATTNNMMGDIYLRCDKGNPGVLYQSIEFQTKKEELCNGYGGVVQCIGDNCVIDNLCIKYSHTMGIATDWKKNIRIQNCEVAFVGGTSLSIGEHDNVPVAGEGIRLDGQYNQAINNYVHDCFDGGIIFEPDLVTAFYDGSAKADHIWGHLLIEGNVIERCMSGILIGVHCEDEVKPKIGDLTIQGNDILYSGYGWSGDAHYDFTWKSNESNGNAITFWDDDYQHGSFNIQNNRLYSARASLVHMGLQKENKPSFNGNTYAQNKNGYLFYSSSDNCCALNNKMLKDCCENTLGDKNAKYLSVE